MWRYHGYLRKSAYEEEGEEGEEPTVLLDSAAARLVKIFHHGMVVVRVSY